MEVIAICIFISNTLQQIGTKFVTAKLHESYRKNVIFVHIHLL
jgi:hypothetical protein